MRVGLLTSWRVPCGIYQYSARLAEALARISEVEPVILAGRADEHRSVPEEWDGEVHDVAKIGMWRNDGRYDIDMIAVGDAEPLDVLHVQYENMLFTQPHLCVLADWRREHGPVAITYHDKCIRGDFPHDAFDLHFSHRWDVGPPNVQHLSFGVEHRPPVVRTFGLGRTRSDYLRPICERHGWVFETIASHEPVHGGGQEWRTHEDLIQWLRGADAVVLWYDEQEMAGESQAARTALAARRPVFVNDVTWFSDLPRTLPGFLKVGSLGELEDRLLQLFRNSYLEQHSWDSVAATLVHSYSQRLAVA